MNIRAPYSLVTAFTSNPFGGNPAAVIHLNPSHSPEFLGQIAKNLNQPVLSVLSTERIPSDDDKTLIYGIKYFAPNGKPIPLCGHGTLAATKFLLSSPEVQAKGIQDIHFITDSGVMVKAVQLDDEFIEIEIPTAAPTSVSAFEKERLKVFVDKAFGRDVVIHDIKAGNNGYEHYVLVELDLAEDLQGSTVDAKQLIGNGFVINVLTTASPGPQAAFVSRMFAPTMINEPGEDHVCGSAHGLLVPHWYSKLGIPSGQEIQVKQVSTRGGDLRVVFQQEEGRIKLRGQCVMLSTGELHI
ncbi:Diaminopimelate epimerase-like protein [Pholiota conissans]|uniref:Diaminopimelate epimerase-like protein n=1 Tax=Pholiota conissans TaxID=109636 RepID=A0A9P6D859_9AGAR|nr:Diaminopimelate epimerase-like protein [Pholiota conissans]